jgi:(S)-ureidoglycine aminohydrolase
MSSFFSGSRTRVERDHALIAPDSHVTSPLAHWRDAEGTILISPAMRGGVGGPRFVQYLATAKGKAAASSGAAPGVERLAYILSGSATLDGKSLAANHFAWFPPGDAYELVLQPDALLLAFEKIYEPLAVIAPPQRVIGTLDKSPAEPFLGDPQAILATLLPIEPAFDMAVNVFTFQPGARLPFVECHVMEHGLYMKQGQGVYRLGENWYPVQGGDTIWMASYCPQWFVAMGTEPAAYIYYKDIHRDPLLVS